MTAMKTMTLTAQIAPDGTLSLELPTGLPPGPAEIVVVVHPTPAGPAAAGPDLADHPAASARPVADATATLEARSRAVQEFIGRARGGRQPPNRSRAFRRKGAFPSRNPNHPTSSAAGSSSAGFLRTMTSMRPSTR